MIKNPGIAVPGCLHKRMENHGYFNQTTRHCDAGGCAGEITMPSAKPWRGWYHVNGNTYGTWLPGDPRGWRERRHRKHVDGDYKKPPRAGTGSGLRSRANTMLVHPPVHLQKTQRQTAQRQTAGRALVEMIIHQEVELLTLSLDDVHFHLLGRFRDRDVRPKVGRAKKHAYHELREIGFQGKLGGWVPRWCLLPTASTN